MTPAASTAGTEAASAATIGNAVIRIDDLHKDFSGKQVLRGVDLAVPPSTVLGLLGRYGSGKTTLIKCALGLPVLMGLAAWLVAMAKWQLP
jgi:ABC-type transporter Mla maintaining outer membrane lipid asymmetry ATPase subunit MlaF